MGRVEYLLDYCGFSSKTTYVSHLNFEKNDKYENKFWAGGEPIDYSYIHVANVSYYMNDGSEYIYIVDNASGTKVNVEP